MKVFSASIPTGLGDLIYIKAMFDPIKDLFNEINLNFHRESIFLCKKNQDYNIFLDDLKRLLFNEKPYNIDTDNSYQYCRLSEIVTSHGILPQKPELSDILCYGAPLNLDKPYIVINTKTRALEKRILDNNMSEFWE